MHTHRTRLPIMLLLAAILLAIFASRIVRVNGIEMHGDEIWSVWQTLGSAEQTIAWTPDDWGPLHFLVVWGWRALVGLHPLALRVISVLVFLPGMALMFRIGRDSWGRAAGWLAMLAYAALGYVMYSSIELRGYALMLALLVAAIWLALCYFQRPRLGTAVGLAVSMAALFYVQMTAVLAFALLGVLTLVCFGRVIWRWWLPGLIALGLVLPRLVGQTGTFSERITTYNAAALPPVMEFLGRTWGYYTGPLAVIWLGLLALSLVLAVRQRRTPDRRWLAMLGTLVVGTVAYYFLTPIFNTPAAARHAWSLVPFIPLVMAYGLSRLPVWGQRAAAGVLLLALAAPVPMAIYYNQPWPNPPTSDSFAWLTHHLRPGDVVLLDSNSPCYDTPMEWEYFTRVYFPEGLTYVQSPEGHARVWYVAHDSQQDSALYAAVQENRVAGKFVGPPECLFRLYEAPPDQEGVLFANGMRFHGVELVDAEGDPLPYAGLRPFPLHEGDALRVRLWWSVDAAVTGDYSVGLHFYDAENALLIQSDSAPQVTDAPPETSRWEPGRYYIEERLLTLPDPVATNEMGVADYTLYLLVYQWWDNQRFSTPGADDLARLPLVAVQIKAW